VEPVAPVEPSFPVAPVEPSFPVAPGGPLVPHELVALVILNACARNIAPDMFPELGANVPLGKIAGVGHFELFHICFFF
jgi:hypothetical protein